MYIILCIRCYLFFFYWNKTEAREIEAPVMARRYPESTAADCTLWISAMMLKKFATVNRCRWIDQWPRDKRVDVGKNKWFLSNTKLYDFADLFCVYYESNSYEL